MVTTKHIKAGEQIVSLPCSCHVFPSSSPSGLQVLNPVRSGIPMVIPLTPTYYVDTVMLTSFPFLHRWRAKGTQRT